MKKLIACSRRNSVGGEIWGPPSPLNPALFRSGAGAERVKKSSERSGAASGIQKIKWSVSGAGGRRSENGVVSGTPVNGAE